MAKCISCNIIISEAHSKNGMCRTCAEKNLTDSLTKSQLEEKIKLKEKYKDLNTQKYLELDNKSKDIRTKYGIEIGMTPKI